MKREGHLRLGLLGRYWDRFERRPRHRFESSREITSAQVAGRWTWLRRLWSQAAGLQGHAWAPRCFNGHQYACRLIAGPWRCRDGRDSARDSSSDPLA